MNVAKKLEKKAQEVAQLYSDKSRASNFNNETFYVDEIVPLSEAAAVVIYMKNTGKKALSLFLYMKTMERWFNIFPTDSHLLALDRVKFYKEEVEKYNFGNNFNYVEVAESVKELEEPIDHPKFTPSYDLGKENGKTA